mmetsp:Transcript_14719/g.30444  ORF Transcript_14719/g.30444 Transcript_14719/m.30444 type:complete len:413 (-) Transcript_14719:284-1522(-)
MTVFRVLPHLLLLVLWGPPWLKGSNAFTNYSPVRESSNGGKSSNSVKFMSGEHSKDETDCTSSLSQSQTPPSSSPSPSQSTPPPLPYTAQQRPRRTEQIERIQGVWWTSENREQLVEIKSSYAIFDAPQKSYVSTTSAMPPAVAYPLGGTEDIVTLRTFKMEVPTPSEDNAVVPEWIPSPTSKVSVQRGGGSAIGTTGQRVSPCYSSTFQWERCTDPENCWKSDRVVQGYEANLTTLLASEGPHWSASPVDVVRACIEGLQSNNQGLVHSLCRFSWGVASTSSSSSSSSSSSVNIGRKGMDNEALESVSDYFASADGPSSWSIVKSHYFSPDVCTLGVKIATAGSDTNGPSFEFCLSREDTKHKKRESSESSSLLDYGEKLPPSLLFNSVMDVELLVNGKTWVIDHICACSK